MADFCMQCSLDSFGKDYGDLKGLSTKEDTENNLYVITICEGCGVIQVDHKGRCISKDCFEKHGGSHDEHASA